MCETLRLQSAFWCCQSVVRVTTAAVPALELCIGLYTLTLIDCGHQTRKHKSCIYIWKICVVHHKKKYPAWMFVLCVTSADKRQNTGQSRRTNKYGWITKQRTGFKKKTRTRPDRPWDPPSLIYDGYRVPVITCVADDIIKLYSLDITLLPSILCSK
jgi:hypothetical protein